MCTGRRRRTEQATPSPRFSLNRGTVTDFKASSWSNKERSSRGPIVMTQISTRSRRGTAPSTSPHLVNLTRSTTHTLLADMYFNSNNNNNINQGGGGGGFAGAPALAPAPAPAPGASSFSAGPFTATPATPPAAPGAFQFGAAPTPNTNAGAAAAAAPPPPAAGGGFQFGAGPAAASPSTTPPGPFWTLDNSRPHVVNSAANVAATQQAINHVCRSRGGHYAQYSCKTVSWDDASRGTVGGGLSAWGSNITDTYLKVS